MARQSNVARNPSTNVCYVCVFLRPFQGLEFSLAERVCRI